MAVVYKCEKNRVIYYLLGLTIYILLGFSVLSGFYMYLVEYKYRIDIPFWTTLITFIVLILLLLICFYTYKNEVEDIKDDNKDDNDNKKMVKVSSRNTDTEKKK